MNTDQTNAFSSALTAVGNFDYFQIIILGGMIISLIVSSFYIKSHPAFFWINLILLLAGFVVVPVMSNVLTEVMDADDFATPSASFPITAYLRDNWPSIVAIMGFIFLVSLYGKRFFNSGGGGVYG